MPDKKPFEETSGATLKEIAQALLTMKQQATSMGNSAQAFRPLTDHEPTVQGLDAIYQMADGIRIQVDQLYNSIAREAMKS